MKKLNHWCFSIPRGVKRKYRFDIGAYQHAKKIAAQNAQAEQSRAVEFLRNCLVKKEDELEKLTKMLDASTKKIERKKRKVRGFRLHNFYIISASLLWQDILGIFTELFNYM